MANNISIQFNANADKISKAIKPLKTDIDKLATSVKKNSNNFDGGNKNLNRFAGSLRSLNTDANRSIKLLGNLNKSFDGLNKSVLGVIDSFKLFITYKLSEVFANSFQSAMDMIETVNLFNVSLGEMATEANKALVELSAITGLDLNNLREATGTYTLLARSMGMANDQASVLGLNTTKLALDLSSLMNVPIEQVYADLRSGLLGQTETVYKYGVDLTEATLQQTAFTLGITESVRTMTQGEKMWLRYETLIRQTALAHGDLAKTIEQPANQIRILGERITTLGRAIGTVFLNAIASVLPYLNAFVSILTMVFQTIASLIGVELPSIEDTVGNIGSDTGLGQIGEDAEESAGKVEDLNKALKDTALGFDEFNTVQKAPESSSGGSGSGGEGIDVGGMLDTALSEYDNKLKDIKTKTDEIIDNFLKWLGLTRELNKETGQYELDIIEGGFADKIREAIENEDWFSVGNLIAGKLNEVVLMAIELVKWDNIKDGISETISQITGIINGFFSNKALFINAGRLLGESINSIVNTAQLFLDETDFYEIGNSIGRFISTSILTIKWDNVGKLIATGISSAIDYFSGIVKQIPFEQIGKNISNGINTAIENLPYEEAGNLISELMNSAIEFSSEVIENFDTDKFSDGILTFIENSIGNIKWEDLTTTITSAINKALEILLNLISNTDWSKVGNELANVTNTFFATVNWNDVGKIIGELITGLFDLLFSFTENYDPTPILEGLIDLIGGILQSLLTWLIQKIENGEPTDMWEAIKKPLGKVVKWLQDYVKEKAIEIGEKLGRWIVDKFSEKLNDMKTKFQEWWDGTVSPWFSKEKWSTLLDNIKTAISEKFNEIKETWTSMMTIWWDENVAPWFTEEKWSELYDTVKTSLKNKWDEFVDWWQNNGVNKWLNEHVKKYFSLSYWNGIVKGAKDGLINGFKLAFNSIIDMAQNAINAIIDALNSLLSVQIGEETIGVTIGHVDLSWAKLARGGMLQGGQLFVAGEFGKAEMVGNYNGKTTVMPLENTDFVNAMYSAVFNAVKEAQGSGGQVIENALYLDGEVIYKNQQKVKSKKGINFGFGNFGGR